MEGRLGNPHSLLLTADHDLHRMRRAALSPMFSSRTVQESFQPVVWEKVNRLCSKVAENGADGNVIALDRAYCAFSGDIITEFAFAKCYNHLDSPGFEETFHDFFQAAGASSLIMMHFPWLQDLMKLMPEWFVLKAQPLLLLMFRMQRVSLMDLF